MRHLIAASFAFALIACGQGTETAAAQDGERSREDIEQIVRDYIMDNPEIMEEALIELQRRARQREEQTLTEQVAASAEALFEDGRDPVVGPADAQVTIVEFFDYKCSYCRMSNDWVRDALDEHEGQVRFIFKEFPVLGPESSEAALAALAVWEDQRPHYLDFHNALMTASGPLPGSRVDTIAAELGIDVDAMRETMEDDALRAHIQDVRALAQEIGVTGTPFFVVNDQVIPGADVEGLERALNEELAG